MPIINVIEVDNSWYVYADAEDYSHRYEHGFDNQEEAETFAQSWADGLTIQDGVECEVITQDGPPEVAEATEADFAMAVAAMLKVVIGLVQTLKTYQAIPEVIDSAVAFKRLYLGTAYAYNILSRCKFLVKSPRVLTRFSNIILWVFLHLPRKLILAWRSPDLRD